MDSSSPPTPPDPQRPGPAPETEETAHYDDAVIGRAFRWSAVVLILLAVSGWGLFRFLKRKPPPPAAQVTQIAAPSVRERPQAQVPLAPFVDITAAAGVRFVHNNGARGEKLLPETMGSGCAFFDFDNDGDADLLFVNATHWPDQAGKKGTTAALYRNDGTGRFDDVTAGSGLDVSFYGMGVACGDFDQDGWVDLFITAVGPNHLFRNLGGGKFQEVTAAAGVGGTTNQWSTCAAWVDIDNDRDLDLFVGNYVRWSRAIDFEVSYTLVGIGRAYGQPMNFEGTFPYLYRNDGNGRFTDISAAARVQVPNPATGAPAAKSLGVAPVDIDSDGWIDLVVANDTVQNFVFHNQRNGTFQELGSIYGIAFDSYGNARGAMGIDAAYFRNDGKLGIIIGNFANEMTALYVAQQRATNFSDEAISEGIGPASRLLLKFGTYFFDYDLDGWKDVLSVNGHLEEEISKIQQSQQYAQRAQLFWNSGPRQSGMVEVPAEKCGTDLLRPIVGRGSAYADIDGDGDLDVVMTQVAGTPLLARNEQQLKRHWCRFKLQGTKSNRDAIGAWIEVRAGGLVQRSQVMPTRSYLSQSELPVTFGLGTNSVVDHAEITWPGGQVQRLGPVRVDALNVIQETSN